MHPHADSPDKHQPARSSPSFGNGSDEGLRHEWRWIALVAAGAVAPCVAILVAGRTLSWRDSASLFEPMRPLIADALRHFHLPLWNPYEAAGIPLFGQMMHGVLHPWSLLAALLTPKDGVDLMIVLHVLTGAIGAGVLARAIGATPAGASVAGLGYGLSGYLLGVTGNLQYLGAGATAPWAIAALQRAGRGSAAIARGAVAIAVLVFAGDPQWAILAAVLGTMLAIERDGPNGAWRAMLAIALGATLTAIQLLPGWAMFAETSRSSGLASTDINVWAFNPSRLVEFIVPGFFAGRPGPTPAPVFLWFEGESLYPLPFLPSVFIGLPLLMCALWGLRATRAARWCGVAVAVLLWMSFGHRLFAEQALAWVPVWGSFRYAEKLIGPCTLLVAVIAGVGLPSFASRGLKQIQPIAWPTSATLVAGAVLLFFTGRATPGPASWPAEIWPLLCLRLAGGLLLAGGTVAVMAVAAARHPSDSSRLERWVVALVLATGVLASPAALHAGRRDARDPQPLGDLRTNTSPVPRVIQPVDQIRLPVWRGFDMFDAAQVVRSATARPSYNVPAQIDAFVTYTGLLPRRYSELLKRLDAIGPARWIAFRRFSVTDVVLTQPLTQGDMEQTAAAVSGGTQVRFDPVNDIRTFQVPHSPWAHFAARVHEAGSEDEAIALTATAAARGDETVILEGAAPATLSVGSVLSVERNVDHLRIVADAPADGVLIVADSWWPGWIAEIDGRPVPIHRADAILRAVSWPAGRHVLEMNYRPHEVYVGAAVSAAAAVLLAGMALVALRSRTVTRSVSA